MNSAQANSNLPISQSEEAVQKKPDSMIHLQAKSLPPTSTMPMAFPFAKLSAIAEPAAQSSYKGLYPVEFQSSLDEQRAEVKQILQRGSDQLYSGDAVCAT